MDLYFKEHDRRREIIISLCVSFFFAYIGPFGTYDTLSFIQRLLYWTIMIFSGGILFWAIIYLINYFALFSALSNLKRHFIIILLFSFPETFIVYLINFIFRQTYLSSYDWIIIWVGVFTITFGITYIIFFSNLAQLNPEADEEKKAENPDKTNEIFDDKIEKFFKKIPKKLGRELISLSSHDHYVEVKTNIGGTMIYIRFSEAISLLEKYPGMRIHRSHWVSFNAIADMKLKGRKKYVTLSDGRTLPVSDGYKEKLQLEYSQNSNG